MEVVYYFNSYDVSEAWETQPEEMVDGTTFRSDAYTTIDEQIELLTGNTCTGADLGTITKVELRLNGSKEMGQTSIDLIPVFDSGDGDVHNNILLTIKSWRPWVDITGDANAPVPWSWADVQNLNCDVRAQIDSGTVYCSQVEIQVTYLPPTELDKRSYGGIPLGLRVRKQIGKDIIFRVRRGNGYQGAILGKAYQDRYDYFVPSSINNPESDSIRALLATAVSNWRNVLTTDQKTAYNKRATKGLHMSGYNLYIREYINSNK